MAGKLTQKQRKTIKEELTTILSSKEFSELVASKFKLVSTFWNKEKRWQYDPAETEPMEYIKQRLTVPFDSVKVYLSASLVRPIDPGKIITSSDVGFYLQITAIYSGRTSVISYNRWSKEVRIREQATEEEVLAKREDRETNYAIIERNGKRALVKFIEGDRAAIQSAKFIRRSKADIDDDDTMSVLFKLNDNLKGK